MLPSAAGWPSSAVRAPCAPHRRRRNHPDDQYPLAQFDFVPVVYVEQEIDGLDHAVQFLAFHRHPAPTLGAYTKERTLVTEFAKLTKAELFVERRDGALVPLRGW